MTTFDPKEVLFLVRLYEDRIQHLELKIEQLEGTSAIQIPSLEEYVDDLAEYHEKQLEERSKKYYDKDGNSNCI